MDILAELFKSYSGTYPGRVTPVGGSGSNRRYFRLYGEGGSAIGVIGTSREENRAFLGMSRHFLGKGLHVPKIYAVSIDGMAYLQEDLGSTQLYDLVSRGRKSGEYSSEERNLLRDAMSLLPDIQFLGAQGMDWSLCYPEGKLSRRAVLFDLSYFKYCFLKPSGIEFNEFALQDDFESLADDLLQCGGDCFMYRDFQARNIMVKDGIFYFIDYQGGRKGPVYYDIASFVWQARARYPLDLKKELVSTYLQSAERYGLKDSEPVFYDRLRIFVLFRTMQVLGAYGFRGNYERKAHFLESIPYAIENLRELLRNPFINYPYLYQILIKLCSLPAYSHAPKAESAGEPSPLTVTIYSFSYKKGIPQDDSGNGGGYVFDCRALNNPGRYEYYRQFNGRDPEVEKFIEDDGGVFSFLDNVYKLVDAHVDCFLKRNFTNLQVSFGCTGGQHRSVYCAEKLAAHLATRQGIVVRLVHRELGTDRVL